MIPPFASSGYPFDASCVVLNGTYLLQWGNMDCENERDFICECPLIECKYALSNV